MPQSRVERLQLALSGYMKTIIPYEVWTFSGTASQLQEVGFCFC